jgi:plasmid maintenance system antidote protein VapI
MLNNLKKVLDAKGITVRAYAKVLGVDERTIQNKIRGRTPFTYQEAVATKKELFPEYDLEYLFKAD